MLVSEITPNMPVKFMDKLGEVDHVIADGSRRVVVRWADSDTDIFHASELAPAPIHKVGCTDCRRVWFTGKPAPVCECGCELVARIIDVQEIVRDTSAA